MTDELIQHHAFCGAHAAGFPIQSAIEQLASEAPQALADLAGDLAIESTAFMQLALPFVPVLEGYVPEKAPRLPAFYPELEETLFALAQTRFPKAWLID